jgi:hypothetical protein
LAAIEPFPLPEFSLFNSLPTALPSTSLFRRPSSKNLLFPSVELVVEAVVAAADETVLLAALGLRTLMPDSLRW